MAGRPGINRVITKKWAQAKAINYDDWDSDEGYDPEEPIQAAPAHGRGQSWDTRPHGANLQGYSNPQGQYYPSNRSVTSPVSTGRTSFDRGDERRNFSNVGGGPYPTTQTMPLEEVQHDHNPNLDSQVRGGHHGQPSLQLQTGGRPSIEQGYYPPSSYQQGPYTAQPRPDQFQDPRGAGAPFSAPIVGPSGRRSHSSGRPAPGDGYRHAESPIRPGSQNSRGGSPSRQFPPRKSSLSQQQAPPDIQQYAGVGVAPVAQAPSSSVDAKALPFIRPADIYRRMEEEKEKERRSQESSRPSLESAVSRARDGPTASLGTGPEQETSQVAAEDTESTKKQQPTLPPVAERKSEYGFDNLTKNAGLENRVHPANRADTGVSVASAASSEYTNRPEPTSASTTKSKQSPFGAVMSQSPIDSSVTAPPTTSYLMPIRGVSDFGSDMFSQRSEPPAQSQPKTSSGTGGAGTDTATEPAIGIQHQPSLGYRSLVNQAFDQSQDQVPPTPVSMSDSVMRSNSASTSDISPIVGKSYAPPISQPPIAEESDSRPGTSGTQTSTSKPEMEKELPPPPAIVPGYRRDSSPTPSNNPEKKPLNIATTNLPESDHANISATSSSTASWDKNSVAGEADESTHASEQTTQPLATAPAHLEQPSTLSRSTSEDWREWDQSRKQFKTQHGVQDSIPSTPDVPSPISRAESPNKGKVRDIANQLGSNSDSNSPAALDPPRSSNARLDSFRPSLPGGWNSYTTNTGSATPQQEKELDEPVPAVKPEEDDAPKAGPPQDHSAFTQPQKTAFAAAAAAGTALAGAFGVSQMSKYEDESRADTTDTSPTSTSLSTHDHEPDETTHLQDRQLETIPEASPPVPPSKDIPQIATTNVSKPDFVAPLSLRHGQGGGDTDQLTPHRSVVPALSTEASPHDDDNDRLRKEIVKSLTPKSSRHEEDPSKLSSRIDFPVTSGSQRTVSSMGDNLPQEYESYWNESAEDEPTTVEAPQAAALGLVSKAPQVTPVSPSKATVTSTNNGRPPMRDTRFSWEASEPNLASAMPPRVDSLGNQSSPDTIKAPTSAASVIESSSEALRPAPSVQVHQDQEVDSSVPPTSLTPTSPTSMFKEAAFSDILALGPSHARVKAFNAHRQHYASKEENDLRHWVQAVGNSHPEHSHVLSSNGIPILRDDGIESAHRPSPARLTTKMDTKQIQDDTKRLAGKFGKKSKGLFDKTKEKIRAVSSGDKGERRNSAQLRTSMPEVQHSSSAPSPPPQIPSQKLEIPPVDHDDWSLGFTPLDDKKLDWENSPTAKRQVLGETSNKPATVKYEVPRPESDSFAAPAPFIGQALPANNAEQSHALRRESRLIAESPGADRQVDAEYASSSQERSTPLASTTAEPVTSSDADGVRQHISTDALDSEKKNSLAAPDRLSMVSNVSSPSPSPADGENGPGSRSVSPPRRSVSNQDARETTTPSYVQHFPQGSTKAEEAEQERAAQVDTAQDEESLPTYTQPVIPGRNAPSRLGENPQIVPVADLRRNEQASGPVQARPFSFAGPEALERLTTTGDTIPPAGDSLNKQVSNVSIEEVQDDANGARNRTSYSRPFGTGVASLQHDHPAYRQPDAIDRSQMYSSESPLPSARRDQNSPVPRQIAPIPQQRLSDTKEEGYRIPGPYVQEYRSPTNRQAAAPFDNRQAPAQPVQNPQRFPETARDRAAQNVADPTDTSTPYGRDMGPPVQTRPEQERSKSKTFGSFFKRDKSPQRSQQRNVMGPSKKEKRGSIFRSSSRQSNSSQGSRLGSLRQTPSREQPYRQNSSDQGARRSSKDLFRSSTAGTDDDQGRKKRFSVGGLFGKSGSTPIKAAQTYPENTPIQQNAYQDVGRQNSPIATHNQNPSAQQSAYHETRQQQFQSVPQQQVQRSSTSGPLSGRPSNEQPYHHQTTHPSPGPYLPEGPMTNRFHSTSPPTNGYYNSDRQYPVSAFPHGPDSVGPGRGDIQSNMTGNRGFVQNPSGAFSARPAQDGEPFSQQRPSDLRINTAASSTTTTRTGYPQATAARTQSPPNAYTQPYPSTRAPQSASVGIPATNRAADLHKRSRSPRLGRHSSSEDLTQRTSNDPAANLGTFSNKSRSPNTADAAGVEGQEKPWAISLPDEENSRKQQQALNSSTGNRGARAVVVAELAGSKPVDYESDEEIILSANAGPSDFWMPSDHYGHWDDD